ncbi:MAG: glutaminyl-peptide cyclotransferase [Cellvibrionaceae bacterium]|nr:glutaminyl-peptide cyclotransferase [Cellvibrionaceae bacterium]
MRLCLALISLCQLVVLAQVQAQPLDFTVLEQRAHDPNSFTQGWEIGGPHIFESSGLYGKSFIRKSELASAELVAQRALPQNWFAEGLTLVGKHIYLLSWRQQRGMVLNQSDLKAIAQFPYRGEGWGLCQMGQELVMSNGSDALQFFDRRFKPLRKLKVHGGKRRWRHLNELECAQGLVWANIWLTNEIIAIDPASGEVKHQVDISSIVPKGISRDAVANGIAYDREKDAYWVTGKFWPKQFLLRLHLPDSAD